MPIDHGLLFFQYVCACKVLTSVCRLVLIHTAQHKCWGIIIQIQENMNTFLNNCGHYKISSFLCWNDVFRILFNILFKYQVGCCVVFNQIGCDKTVTVVHVNHWNEYYLTETSHWKTRISKEFSGYGSVIPWLILIMTLIMTLQKCYSVTK